MNKRTKKIQYIKRKNVAIATYLPPSGMAAMRQIPLKEKKNNNNNKAIAIENTTKLYTHRQRQKKSHYTIKRAKMQRLIKTSNQTRHQKKNKIK